MLTQLDIALEKNKLSLTAQAKAQLLQYLQLLLKWNRVYNLTTITHSDEMIYLHIIDSLIIAPYIKGTRCLDVGTGAGLPGIPLAIMNPDINWVLLDKNNKKIRFLVQVIAELGLKNVGTMHSRIEDFHPTHCFDNILSRAFTQLDKFVLTSKHLICADGIFIAMKGKYPQAELATLPTSITIEATIPLKIEGITVERHLINMRINHEDSSWGK